MQPENKKDMGRNSIFLCVSTDERLTVGDNPPSLVISLVPFPKHNGGAITDTTRFLITMKSIYIQANVIDHSYSPVTIPYVLALCPQYRLIQNIWIIGYQLHLQTYYQSFMLAY